MKNVIAFAAFKVLWYIFLGLLGLCNIINGATKFVVNCLLKSVYFVAHPIVVTVHHLAP